MLKDKFISLWRLCRPNKALTKQAPIPSEKQTGQEIKRLALKKLFHQSAFSKLDGLNEYDEDYTEFTPLGDLITQEMQAHLDQMQLQTAQTEVEPKNLHPNESDTA